MKQCPQCSRVYADDALNFCLDDGAWLTRSPADLELPTAIISGDPPSFRNETQRLAVNTGGLSSETPATKPSRKYLLIGLFFGAVVLAGLLFGLYRFGPSKSDSLQTKTSGSIRMQPLTSNGNVRNAVISPDGKFLAYVQSDSGQQSLWTKQISTNSNVQVVPPSDRYFEGMAFTPDGSYVYYSVRDQGELTAIYRVSALGSEPLKIVSAAGSKVSFSPDGSQFAFERFDNEKALSTLVIANADGSNERVLLSRTGHEFISTPSIAWSPDGKVIACSLADDRKAHPHRLSLVNISDGTITDFAKTEFDGIGAVVWLKDMTEVVFIASDQGENVAHQIWEMSYPGGDARKITYDATTGYTDLSITSDSRTLVSLQRRSSSNIQVAPDADISKVQQITRGQDEGDLGISWTPDGRIVYGSMASGASEIWIADADGSHSKQLTNDGISKYTPVVSADGKYIVFASEKQGAHIWRMNIDGSQVIELTHGTGDGNPRVSPDSQWVVYSSWTSGIESLWRVPLGGGDAQNLTDYSATEPDVSPDGKYLSCFTGAEGGSKKNVIAVLTFDGGRPLKTFDLPQTTLIDMSPIWTPDGRGLTYVDAHGDVSNLWLQPVSGGRPKQVTNYKQGNILRREWSRDGKRVAIVRASQTSDAVTITGF
jgi:Tol biopolymer transport system component